MHRVNGVKFCRRRRGGNARIVRSNSRVTKFFVAGGAGTAVVDVGAFELAREGAVAAEDAMVDRGGSVIDPRRLA